MPKFNNMQVRERNLTEWEVQILTHIAQGLSNSETAVALESKETSVTSALAKIRRKLDARTTVHAVVIALRRGLI